jgi:hypothetical protein
VKYAPQAGTLKGFSTNVGYTFVGATPTETPIAGDTYVTQAGGVRVVTSSTGQWALESPAYGIWNLGVRYKLKGNSNFSHEFAVNLNNATDVQYFRAGAGTSNSKYIGDHRAVYFTYTLGHKSTSL